MNLRHPFILLFFFVSAISTVADNSWFARPWRTDDGLPDNTVSSIAQSPDGFLWIGTPSGLARFDGARFESFSPGNVPGTSSRIIRVLTFDHDGRLWMGTDRGNIVCADDNHAHTFSAKGGLPDQSEKQMVVDGDGAIWICYLSARSGITRIQDGKVTVFEADQLPRSGATWLATDVHGQLWFARGGDVGTFRDGRFQVMKTVDENPVSIAGSRDGGLWICSPTHLWKLDESNHLSQIARIPQPSGFRKGEAAGLGAGPLLESRDGTLWLASGRTFGLFHFNGKSFELVPTTHPVINCLMEDREGNLWVGTGGGGMDRLRPKVIDLLNIGSLPTESIHSICEDTDGSLWSVSRDGDVTHVIHRSQPSGKLQMPGSEFEIAGTLNNKTNWPGGLAACVASDSRGGLWIGTHGDGLYHYENDKFTVFFRRSGGVRSILTARNGDVWLGVDGGRLQRWRNGQFQLFNLPPDSRYIRAMTEDAQSNIWIATSEGLLLRVQDDDLINETTNFVSELTSIRCLCGTLDGSLWIGYAGGGLGRIKDGKYSRLTTAQGLDDDYISQIVADNEGWLWIAGSSGLFRVRLQQLNDMAENPKGLLRCVTFGSSEGMSGLQANYDYFPAAFRGRDGRIRIATHTGVVIINPKNIRDSLHPPSVYLERVVADDKTLAQYDNHSPLRIAETNAVDLKNVGASLRLPPNFHRLEFDFTALSFTAPENVHFRYQLEGVDGSWVESGAERRVIYSRLPAGNYRFHVVACNNSFVWSPVGAVLSFSVQPFFWQTWWFKTSVLAAFALAIGALVRYVSFRRLRVKLQLLEQQSALDKERARIARDLHDDLGGSLTQVGLLLDVAARNHNGNGNGGSSEMQKCSTMVRNVANSVDEIIWAINPRNDTAPYLVDYLSQFVVEFLHNANLQCRVHLPDEIPTRNVSPEARHNLFLAVKESLNNIARHAQASEVHFQVAADAEEISIIIEDNGQGFQIGNPNHREPGSRTGELNEDGLRNMRQRMEEIGGQFRIESKSETGSSAAPQTTGTRVSLIYPWPDK